MNLLQAAQRYANGVATLTEWLGSGGETVDHWKAQDRAETCLRCPMNKDGLQLAEAVAAAIKRQVELKNQLHLRVQGERALYTCQACLCPLRTKIWLPLARVKPEDDERANYDPNCWLLKETE